MSRFWLLIALTLSLFTLLAMGCCLFRKIVIASSDCNTAHDMTSCYLVRMIICGFFLLPICVFLLCFRIAKWTSLIVLVSWMILFALIGIAERVGSARLDRNLDMTRHKAATIIDAIEMYHSEKGRYPIDIKEVLPDQPTVIYCGCRPVQLEYRPNKQPVLSYKVIGYIYEYNFQTHEWTRSD